MYPKSPPWNILEARARARRALRQFFDQRGFLEIETPALRASTATDPYIESFRLQRADGSGPYFLQSSPEFPHKIFLAQYRRPIYELARVFRDEPSGRLHRPEFLLVEWYEPEADYRQLMATTTALLLELARTLGVDSLRHCPAGESASTVPLDQDFECLSCEEAFVRELGFSPLGLTSRELYERARALGSRCEPTWSWNDYFNLLLLDHIEAKLGFERPCYLMDYPASMASLAKTKLNDKGQRVAERFELYVAGIELCNGYSELSDAKELRRRFEEDNVEREKLGLRPVPIDEVLLEALPKIGRVGGNALGFERLLMLLLGLGDISELRIDF